jgi:hypothetical protein
MQRPRVVAAVCTIAVTLHAAQVRAQPVTTVNTATPAQDIVQLKDGSFFRGTIMALVAGDHVELLLPSGETRRFSMADVETAGPASSTSPSSTPLPQLEKPLVRVAVDAGDVKPYVWSAAGWYQCNAPCVLSVPVGRRRFTGQLEGSAPVVYANSVDITGPGTLHLQYHSHAFQRTVGGILVAAGLLGGIVLLSAAPFVGPCNVTSQCPNTGANAPMVVVGLASFLVGLVGGGALLSRSDWIEPSFVPAQ